MADIIDDFITRLAAAAPDLQPDVKLRLESALRQEWGGSKSYVAKRFSVATRTAVLSSALIQRHKLADCFAQAGVSRRTGYRLLDRKNK